MTASPALRVPRQDRALRTRQAILDAARRQFSAEGHAATTSRTIAEAAGVSVGSLYQYFQDKDHILREIAAERAAAIGEATLAVLEASADDGRPLHERAAQRLEQVVWAVVAAHRDDPGLHSVLTERRHVDPELDAITTAFEEGLVRRTATLLESWEHPGDALATAFVLFSMVEGAVHAHVLGTPMVDDDRLFSCLHTALLRVALPHHRG